MRQIPLFDNAFDEHECAAAERVIRSGWLTMGKETEAFEERFAKALDVKHAVAVSSGTAALHVAHLAVGVGAEDEVLCPSLTFVAGAHAIVYAGGRPVFVDIENEDSLCVSVQDMERRLTPRTKAVQVMHYAGYPCDMNAVMRFAQKNNLRVIEDAAHALTASYNGRLCGTIGDIGCFSFFSNKNMTTAEGGMITTSNDEIAGAARLLRAHGRVAEPSGDYPYDVVRPGYNYRIDEIRSAIGMVQLEKLEKNNARRTVLAGLYRERLQAIPGIRVPFLNPYGTSAHHILPVLVSHAKQRTACRSFMQDAGIQTTIHYPPIHRFAYYEKRHDAASRLPVTEDVTARQITLPLYPEMSENDVGYVCDRLAYFMKDERTQK